MLTYRAFRSPGSNFTTHVATSVCYVVLFEDEVPIGRLWSLSRPDEVTGEQMWQVDSTSILWPTNTTLRSLPGEYEGLPQCRIEYEGYFGGHTVTLPDGRTCRLPLTSGGYLTTDRGGVHQ